MQLAERDKELSALADVLQCATSQRGQLVLVTGEAGIGKSTLLEAFVTQLPPYTKALWGYCDDLLTPRPFGPIFDLAIGLGEKVSALMRNAVSGPELFSEILSAISALPSGSVLIIEDMHWADHATIDLLRYLARRMVTMRVMIILTFRPDEITPNHAVSLLLNNLPANVTSRLELAALTEAGVALLAKESGVFVEGLFEATAGNPFFVAEILAQPPRDGRQLPTSVRDAVVTRLSRLDEAQQRLLEALSVVPEPVHLEWIGAVLGASMIEVCAQCIEKRQLVASSDQQVRFRHELARICTLSIVSADKQNDYHRQFLDYHYLKGGSESLSLLVHHAHALKDGLKVLETAPIAAAGAAGIGAHNEAAAFLACAREYVHEASPQDAAQIHEDWAYEAGLVLQMGHDVLDARHQAINLWRKLGRLDKVGLNLRWLWRLHWYRGETHEAKAAADEAILTLESIAPSKELGMAYSMRSQVYFLNSINDEAIRWAERALGIANQFDDVETRIHAMTNIATTRLLCGDHTARPMMEEALALAYENGLHEHAARVYTNYSEYAILVRDWALAERIITEGLAFDAKHNLDSWTYYLVGRQAQMRLDQGRLGEACTIAHGALAIERLTAVMRIPALTSLAIAQSRLGLPDGINRLNDALELALDLKEPQNIIPVRFGLIEHFVLSGDIDKAQKELVALARGDPNTFSPWDSAQVLLWGRRLGVSISSTFGNAPTPAQALELDSKHADAAKLHEANGTPMEAVFVTLFAPTSSAAQMLIRAISICERIEASAGTSAIRRRANELKLNDALPKPKRGPYKAVRNHPLGLSAKEVEVLSLMIEGANNPEIASKVNRSRRTIEHHVSAILAKMGVANRLEAILRTLSEPWIVAD